MSEPLEAPKSAQSTTLGARRLRGVFFALLVLAVLAEFGMSLHPHFGVEALPGFHAAYALLAGVAVIALARFVGALLRRQQAGYGVDDE